MREKGITPRQQKLADCVLAGMTLAEAHKAAGYRAKRPGTQSQSAHEVMKKPEVVEYVRRQQEVAAEKAVEAQALTKEWVIEQLKKNAALGQKETPAGVPMNIGASNTAVVALGKEIGMFIERKEITTFDVAQMRMADLYAEAERAREDLARVMGLFGMQRDDEAPSKAN